MNHFLAILILLSCALAGDKADAADKKPRADAKEAGKPDYVFYPPAPAEPRVQYLTSYSVETDLSGGPGKFARFLVGKEPPKKGIVKPYGIAVHAGRIFVCDTSARCVVILDLNKKKMDILSPSGQAEFKSPIDIAVDQDGTRYVTDSGRGQVLVFDQDNAYVDTMVSVGATNSRPAGVAVGKDRIYVSDVINNCVTAYDRDSRKPVLTFPKAVDGTNRLSNPTGLELDSQGRIYVSEMIMASVKVYDAEGKLLRTIGKLGDRPGEFARPKGVALDREDRLYVVDAASQVVQLFNPEGRILMDFGNPKSGAGALELPAGIAIDYDDVGLFQKYAAPGFTLEHLVLVSSQLGERKINVYGFGHKQ
jgi:sugar lactone lactonase YvrE